MTLWIGQASCGCPVITQKPLRVGDTTRCEHHLNARVTMTVASVGGVTPNKPHLRLRYTPPGAAGNRSGHFSWSVEYIRGPSKRLRHETYQHNSAWGALASARTLWF